MEAEVAVDQRLLELELEVVPELVPMVVTEQVPMVRPQRYLLV